MWVSGAPPSGWLSFCCSCSSVRGSSGWCATTRHFPVHAGASVRRHRLLGGAHQQDAEAAARGPHASSGASRPSRCSTEPSSKCWQAIRCPRKDCGRSCNVLGRRSPTSVREPEVHHVAVLDDVLLAFLAHLAGFLGADLAAQADVVVVGDGLGADEALLEVGVDDAGGLRRLGALVDGPGARLLGADGEEGDEVATGVALADQRG